MRLAARGVRNMDDGEQTIEEAAIAQQLRKQANQVQIQSVGLGVGLTLLTLILPVVTRRNKS